MFVRVPLTLLVLVLQCDKANAQSFEAYGSGFCTDAEGLFYARGESERFEDAQSCLDNCLLLDDSDLVGFAYKSSNQRCHCSYNVGSAVIDACDAGVFANGCRSNQGYTGSGAVSGTSGNASWQCYTYDRTPTAAPTRWPTPIALQPPKGHGKGTKKAHRTFT